MRVRRIGDSTYLIGSPMIGNSRVAPLRWLNTFVLSLSSVSDFGRVDGPSLTALEVGLRLEEPGVANIYSHVAIEQQRAAAEQLGEAFRG